MAKRRPPGSGHPATNTLVPLHASLRAPDEAARHEEMRRFIADLRIIPPLV